MAASNTHPVKIRKDVERLGWLMDDLFRVPVLGWRFGLDALIGLIPGLGDTSTALVSFYILAAAVRHGVPKITILRMGLNIGINRFCGECCFARASGSSWAADRRAGSSRRACRSQ